MGGALERNSAVDEMHYFDSVLSTPYVAGEQFSMAEITLWAGLYFVAFAEITIPEECTSPKTWHAKVSERP